MSDDQQVTSETEGEKPAGKKPAFFNIPSYEQKPSAKKSKTLFLILILLVIALIGSGLFLRERIKNLVKGDAVPSPSSISEATPSPSPTPDPLVRSEWSFEVLNGSGTSGLAKKVASSLEDLGYQVIKTGNADKSNYSKTEILVKKDQLEKIDLVIADLKDVIKIASVAGELDEGTASARIIIGKDSI